MNNTTGSSPKGDLPFLPALILIQKKQISLWRCNEGIFENVVKVMDPDKLTLAHKKGN